MPTASDEDRNLMLLWFGDAIDEIGPIRLLKSHGYVLDEHWRWHKPTKSHTVSEIEWHCLSFLINEWDFDIAF
jgi:hypothetical protein